MRPEDWHRCIRVRLPNGASYRRHFEKDGQPVLIEVDDPLTLDEASLSRIAVLADFGIGFFMEADVRDDIATGRLVRVLETGRHHSYHCAYTTLTGETPQPRSKPSSNLLAT